jgi:hypothetical protein
MYGSNFIAVTLKPLLLSILPIEAVVIPLPMDDITPPANKYVLTILPKLQNSKKYKIKNYNDKI